ncbi:MAG: tetratricopeptide repeat protein [Pyrinomonadaceae bacterium]
MNTTKKLTKLCALLIILCFLVYTGNAQERRRPRVKANGETTKRNAADSDNANTPNEPAATDSPNAQTPVASGDDAAKTKFDQLLQLPSQERVERLKALIKSQSDPALKLRARELLVSALASLGDEKLKAGDTRNGINEFTRAIEEAPAQMSDKLYAEVVSQLPLSLFVRNERAAATSIARLIETKVADDPKRLLVLAGFYLSVEQPDDAARVGELAIKLAPDNAAAYRALGAARQIAFNLDDAATAYARALELDPQSNAARRSLADLRRAGGKPEEALTLYREALKIDATDKVARAGIVLALFDAGKKEEAERELAAALKDEPRNLPLLVGAAYYYTAHGDGAHALDLAGRAVQTEPRYTWAQIALARALILQKQPLAAEQALRGARAYGNFPTLDYELASALAAAGLYEEATAQLKNSFTLRDNQIETKLAGRTPARAANFIELLAPERRAGIAQFAAADTEANASILKALLVFNAAMNPAGGKGSIDESQAVAAAVAFASGDDEMRSYRQLYAATRLLQNNLAPQTALDLTSAATGGIDAALDAPTAAIAALADEIADVRASSIAAGTAPPFPVVNRNTLANILRGRLEDLSGWALLVQSKAPEAATRLRRAISVLPENSIWWRNAMWRLGTSLEQSGNQTDALTAYLRSYKSGTPNIVRRAVIEALYRKLNGSLDGLDAKLGTDNSSISSNAKESGADSFATRPASEQPETSGATESTPIKRKRPAKKP